ILAGMLGKPLKPLLRRLPGVGARLAAMVELAPGRIPTRSAMEGPAEFPPEGPRRKRVALLSGCAQPVLRPSINEATIRLLGRHGIEVVLPRGEGCCGALVHHLGDETASHGFARRNIDAWIREMDGEGLDAIVITASGCGTTIKDYGFMFRLDPAYAEKAARVSAIARDVTELIGDLEPLPKALPTGQVVAYHSACSMQHGQKITDLPKRLLREAGFAVRDVPEGHICCGSAGTYNILQPEIAGQLRARKVANIERTRPAIVATGNIGCMAQIGKGLADRGNPVPVVHTVELLDWATGGPMPEALEEAGFGKARPSPLAEAAE
ncbi:MAG: heterodisulfide reductase-related iron-sulfur binding cluster, partial [Alsobacter sp.]